MRKAAAGSRDSLQRLPGQAAPRPVGVDITSAARVELPCCVTPTAARTPVNGLRESDRAARVPCIIGNSGGVRRGGEPRLRERARFWSVCPRGCARFWSVSAGNGWQNGGAEEKAVGRCPERPRKNKREIARNLVNLLGKWSGRRDSDPGPPAPKAFSKRAVSLWMQRPKRRAGASPTSACPAGGCPNSTR
jgi:hypothetical protein